VKRWRGPFQRHGHHDSAVASTLHQLRDLVPEGVSPPAESDVLRERVRWGSVNLEVRTGGGPEDRLLFVKRIRSRSAEHADRGSVHRARLKPVPDREGRIEREAVALGAIERMVAAAGDDRWLAVPVVTALPDTLVLEHVALPTLADLIERGEPPEVLAGAAESLGAWLRQFHARTPFAHSRPHLGTAREVADLLGELSAHVAGLGARDVALLGAATEPMCAELPAEMPLVQAHGDLTPSNVFVDERSRVGVFDTAGDLRTPPHFDLAYFAVMVELVGVRRLAPARGRQAAAAALAAHMRAGYGQAPDPAELRPFELAVLLEKQASLVSPSAPSALHRRAARSLRRTVLVRRFQESIEARLAEHLRHS
jgi:hypothetical protein